MSKIVEMLGAPKRIAEKPFGSSITAPQHDIDSRIALLAFANLDRTQKYLGASGQTDSGKMKAVTVTRRMCIDCNRRLAKNSMATLSSRQRELLSKWLTEADMVHVKEAIVDVTPECLKPENLPKRPPTRRNFNGNV